MLPRATLETAQFARFGRMFGELEINVANQFHEPGFPEVMVLSNMTSEGKPVGLGDAGQGWHTDMSYSREIALANVLHAIKVPRRDGGPLGDTQFRNMHAAYEDLPADIKTRLKGRTATHDFAKFWDMMRARPGSLRAALTPEQRAKKPPVSQPIFRTHPITGRTILYCNPGYAMRIDGLPEAESDELLHYLFEHQEQEKYFHAHKWAEGDVLMWDNIGTVHNAVPDYRRRTSRATCAGCRSWRPRITPVSPPERAKKNEREECGAHSSSASHSAAGGFDTGRDGADGFCRVGGRAGA